MEGKTKLFVISTVFIPILLILMNISSISDFYTYSVPMDKMTVWEDMSFDVDEKFAKINEKKDSRCFTTPSMNYFCYAKPMIHEQGHLVSYLFSNTTGINGEIHFDDVISGTGYFTIKKMIQVSGNIANIIFADNNYWVGNATTILYKIEDHFEFAKTVDKFDTFIAKCNNYEGTSVTIVQYLGITNIEGMDYFVTWHTVANSDSGIVCKYPQVIQHSFEHDFGI